MYSINKQLYLVSRCIKLKTSLPSDCIMERLIQTIVELFAFVSIYRNTQYAYNVKINEKAYWGFFIVLLHTGYKGLCLCWST